MKKRDVKVGLVYAAMISNKLVPVRLDSESIYGGWNATNLRTNRKVRIKTAGKLRFEVHQCERSSKWHRADHK